MKIWAIADLHLAISCPEKDMALIAPNWEGYMEKIATSWKEQIEDNDLVLIPGDISWAMRPEQAKEDLLWIEDLPGMKLCIRGNHDYWWSSISKVRSILPPSVEAIAHNEVSWNNISITGTRFWDDPQFVTHEKSEEEVAADWKIFEREMGRLELALKALDPKAKQRIVMTHFPPIGGDMADSRASKLFERYKVNTVVFGHLHQEDPPRFGTKNNIDYILASADYLEFAPKVIMEMSD